MLALISPAKTLNLDPLALDLTPTQIIFKKEVNALVGLLQAYRPEKLAGLMNISEKLAIQNAERYAMFNANKYTLQNAKPALFTFEGDVYKSLAAHDFNARDIQFAQEHLLMLSGLYGVLRPLDLMQPYRLEMGTKLDNEHGKHLYAFWGDKITLKINALMAGAGSQVLVNLASIEYFKAINQQVLTADVLHIDFKEYRDGQYKTIAFLAKKARGMMARFIIKNQLMAPESLKGFVDGGYQYHESLSRANHFVFTR